MNKFAVIAALVAFTGARRHHNHHRAAEMGPYQFVRVQTSDPEGDLAAATAAEDKAKAEVDADAKADAGKTPAEKAEAADKEASKAQDKLGGDMATLSAEEQEEAEKEAAKAEEERMAKLIASNHEYAMSHTYFDGEAWASNMPEEIIKQTPGKLNFAFSQLRHLENRY